MAVSERVRNEPILVAGEWWSGDDRFGVVDPFSGETVAEVSRAGAAEIERALAAAKDVFAETSRLPRTSKSQDPAHGVGGHRR